MVGVRLGGAGALFVFLSLLLFAFARYFIKEEEEDEPGSLVCNVKLNDLLPVPDAQGKKIISSTALI